MGVCPKCANVTQQAGAISVRGPGSKIRNVPVYYCKICRWRGT